jgi:hypothetical protein
MSSTVHASEQHRGVVHEDLRVADLDAAEADLEPRALTRTCDDELVQRRVLRRPRAHARDPDLVARAGDEAERVDTDARVAVCVDPQDPVARLGIEVGGDADVAQRPLGNEQERHGAEDARHPPHVLVFEVARGTELHDAYAQVVDAGPGVGRDVELVGVAAACGRAHLVAVEPDLRRVVDAVESQEHALVRDLGDLDVPLVVTGRVRIGHMGRIRRKWEDDVRVGRRAVALQLPVAGHPDFGLALRGLGGRLERALIVNEAPLPAEVDLGGVGAVPGSWPERAHARSEAIDEIARIHRGQTFAQRGCGGQSHSATRAVLLSRTRLADP